MGAKRVGRYYVLSAARSLLSALLQMIVIRVIAVAEHENVGVRFRFFAHDVEIVIRLEIGKNSSTIEPHFGQNQEIASDDHRSILRQLFCFSRLPPYTVIIRCSRLKSRDYFRLFVQCYFVQCYFVQFLKENGNTSETA